MNMQLLENILTAYGPSGHEGRVADVIRTALEGHVDEIYTDAMGSLIAVKNALNSTTGSRISPMIDFRPACLSSLRMPCTAHSLPMRIIASTGSTMERI